MRDDREELLLLLLQVAKLGEVVHRRDRRDDPAARHDRTRFHVDRPLLTGARVPIHHLEARALAGERAHAHRARRIQRLATVRVVWLKHADPLGAVGTSELVSDAKQLRCGAVERADHAWRVVDHDALAQRVEDRVLQIALAHRFLVRLRIADGDARLDREHVCEVDGLRIELRCAILHVRVERADELTIANERDRKDPSEALGLDQLLVAKPLVRKVEDHVIIRARERARGGVEWDAL